MIETELAPTHFKIDDDGASRAVARSFWSGPWGVRQSLTVVALVLLNGFAIQAAGHNGVPSLIFPSSLIGLLTFTASTFFLHRKLADTTFVKWLTSLGAGLTWLGVFACFCLVMGLVPQESAKASAWVQAMGLNRVIQSWPYAFTLLFLATHLCLITYRRWAIRHPSRFSFAATHLGLAFILLIPAFGNGDVRHWRINLHEGFVTGSALDEHDNMVDLPFAIKLRDFSIEEFAPALMLVDPSTRDVFAPPDRTLFTADQTAGRLRDWQIKILQYLPMAAEANGRYYPLEDVGSTHAVLVEAYNAKTRVLKTGWLSSGSFRYPPRRIRLDHEALALSEPRPKRYGSDLIVFRPEQNPEEVRLEVNSTWTFGSWKLYQLGYDKASGRWSDLSLLEAVYDPWVTPLYMAVLLMLTGTFVSIARFARRSR